MSNAPEDIGDRILQAAASCVRDYGVDRVTLAEIARRTGVSRPTVYRRWPDTRSIISALLTSHVTDVVRAVSLDGHDRQTVVRQVVAVADRLRGDELVKALMHSDLARVYITERLGASQHFLLEGLAARLQVAQGTGSVRAGDPRKLAAMVLLITQSTIQSVDIIDPILDSEALAAELTYSLNGYLA